MRLRSAGGPSRQKPASLAMCADAPHYQTLIKATQEREREREAYPVSKLLFPHSWLFFPVTHPRPRPFSPLLHFSPFSVTTSVNTCCSQCIVFFICSVTFYLPLSTVFIFVCTPSFSLSLNLPPLTLPPPSLPLFFPDVAL